MAITFSCVHCKRTISIKESYAGKKGLCPKCRKPIVVPMQSTAPSRREVSDADLEAMAVAAVAQKPMEEQASAFVEHTCPYCDASLRFAADLAGRNAPCPECKRVIKVPQLARTGPRDWRQPETQTGPSGAKLSEAEAQAKQNWASQAAPTQVSRQALVDARAIPVERERLSVGQWAKRGALVVTLVLVVGGATLWYLGFRQGRLEERSLAMAEKAAAVAQKSGWSPELQAQFQGYLGLYYHRTGKVDEKGRGAPLRFQMARQAAGNVTDPNERAAVIREVLVDLISSTGDTEELATLLSVAPPAARELLIQEMTRLLAPSGSSPEVVADRALRIRQIVQRAVPAQVRHAPTPRGENTEPAKTDSGTGTSEMDYGEQLACLAAAGLELARLGYVDAAREFAEATASLVKTIKEPPVPVLALWMAANKPVPEQGIDAESRQAAQVASLARTNNLAKAKVILDQGLKGKVALRLATVLDLAETLLHNNAPSEALPWARHAVTLLEPLRLEDTIPERQRLLELLSVVGEAGEMEKVGNRLLPADSLPAQRARVAVFRQTGLNGSQPIEASQIQAVASAPGPAAVLHFLAGQHNARINPGQAVRWAEAAQSESFRAFAALGSALGIAEQRKQ